MNMMTSFNKNYTPSRSYIQEYADIFLKEAPGVLPTHADHDYNLRSLSYFLVFLFLKGSSACSPLSLD